MNKLPKYRHFIVATIGILSLVMSLGNSVRAYAAQNIADVSITIVANKSRVKVGENISYTVTATNHGPDAALFVNVSLGLVDQLNYVATTCAAGISSGGASCLYPILEPGQSVVTIFIATPNPYLLNHDRNALKADASATFATTDTLDPDRGNNLVSVTLRLIGSLTHP